MSVTVTQGVSVVRMAGWPVTVGVVEVGVFTLHTGLAGRGDGYQCGLDWGVLVPLSSWMPVEQTVCHILRVFVKK